MGHRGRTRTRGGATIREGRAASWRLILDGQRRIEVDGQFVTGRAALEWAVDRWPFPSSGSSLNRLSVFALRYASAFRGASVKFLTERLYAANSSPVTSELARRFGSGEHLPAALGLSPGQPVAEALARRWTNGGPLEPAYWWTWDAGASPDPTATNGLRFKVYLSPTFPAVGAALRLALPVLSRHGCPSFKIGGTLEQLLRPDKWVAYFFDRRQQQDVAADLARALRGIPGQGVPFTASVDESPTVSWAVDPPTDADHPGQDRDSWRTWLTTRLARYLVSSRRTHSTMIAPWQFALARLQLDGVDVERWTRSDERWLAPSEAPGLRTT